MTSLIRSSASENRQDLLRCEQTNTLSSMANWMLFLHVEVAQAHAIEIICKGVLRRNLPLTTAPGSSRAPFFLLRNLEADEFSGRDIHAPLIPATSDVNNYMPLDNYVMGDSWASKRSEIACYLCGAVVVPVSLNAYTKYPGRRIA